MKIATTHENTMKKMKITTKTLTTTTVETKTTWERLEALKKAFPKHHVGYAQNVEGNEKEGFVFVGEPLFPDKDDVFHKALIGRFHDELVRVLEQTDEKSQKAETRDQAKYKKLMDEWVAPVPSKSKNKLVIAMDEIISSYVKQVEQEMSKKDLMMAACYAGDTLDFVVVRDLIEKGKLIEAYKHARHMDTCPRESIPDNVYTALEEADIEANA